MPVALDPVVSALVLEAAAGQSHVAEPWHRLDDARRAGGSVAPQPPCLGPGERERKVLPPCEHHPRRGRRLHRLQLRLLHVGPAHGARVVDGAPGRGVDGGPRIERVQADVEARLHAHAHVVRQAQGLVGHIGIAQHDFPLRVELGLGGFELARQGEQLARGGRLLGARDAPELGDVLADVLGVAVGQGVVQRGRHRGGFEVLRPIAEHEAPSVAHMAAAAQGVPRAITAAAAGARRRAEAGAAAHVAEHLGALVRVLEDL